MYVVHPRCLHQCTPWIRNCRLANAYSPRGVRCGRLIGGGPYHDSRETSLETYPKEEAEGSITNCHRFTGERVGEVEIVGNLCKQTQGRSD
jgi:hypothetical protein